MELYLGFMEKENQKFLNQNRLQQIENKTTPITDYNAQKIMERFMT